jgi:hypothetical protein
MVNLWIIINGLFTINQQSEILLILFRVNFG